MKFRTVFSLVRSGQIPLLIWAVWKVRAHYRLAFIAGGLSSGLFRKLAAGPVRLERLVEDLALKPHMCDGLHAWLELGVGLGELRSGTEGYVLCRKRTKKLLRPDNDTIGAIIEEAAMLAGSFVSQGPLRFISANSNGQELFSLADQNGPLVARTSRVSAPFICEALESVLPRHGAFKLLEIGCGSAAYIRYAAAQNPDLTALGLEFQPDVAAGAMANISKWNLSTRVTIEACDIMQKKAERIFDLATLHQNIYYFPVQQRVILLRHVREFLKPGGRLLVTTCCQGGAAGAGLLDFWASMTAGCGRLPPIAEMVAQLKEAGFRDVSCKRLIPGESFYAFVGTNAPAQPSPPHAHLESNA